MGTVQNTRYIFINRDSRRLGLYEFRREKHNLDELPSHARKAANIKRGELLKGSGGEVEVVVGAAFAAVDNTDGHTLAFV